MTEEKKSRWKKLKKKLNDKYRLDILNDTTFERKFTFRLSQMNVFIATGTLVILLVIGTTFLIAYTPLREYIPGYGDVHLQKDLYYLNQRTDSLQHELLRNQMYIQNLHDIISSKDFSNQNLNKPHDTIAKDYSNLNFSTSEADSLLREEFENLDQYNLHTTSIKSSASSIKNFFFFTPLRGVVSNGFNPAGKHYGIDIVSKKNEAINATLDGMVIFSGWTLETGYVIVIQHQSNIISVYKHNSVLLKNQGDFVKAGDPVAIIGGSGELSTGLHLHFELWHNGNPVNPREYILL